MTKHKTRVVVLTNNGSVFGKTLLLQLKKNSVRIHGIVVIKQPLKYYLRQFRSVRKQVGLFQTIYFSAIRLYQGFKQKERLPSYTSYGVPVHFVDGTNTQTTVDIVSALHPDLLLLGQTGIIKEPLLRIPKIGALNSHPGLLPWYRGIDCAAWAVRNNEFDKVGCTVHWVDAGVDTGGIIHTKQYMWSGDENLELLVHRLDNLAIEEMAIVVQQKFYEKKYLNQSLQQGKQFYKMSLCDERIARKNLSAFLRNRK